MTRLVLAPGDDAASALRAAVTTESVVAVVMAGRDPLALATARIAVEVVAVERAPVRVNAVLAGAGASPAAVEAAAAYLDGAASVTGQWLAVD